MSLMLLAPLALLLTSAARPAAACETVAAPSGDVVVTFCLDDGVPTYAVQERGRPVVTASRLGLSFQGGIALDRGFVVHGTARASRRDTWEQVWGEQRLVQDHYDELRVELRQASAEAHRLTLVFRAYDDGAAFRYEMPAQPGLEAYVLTQEHTEFAFANHKAWWIPAYKQSSYEQLYQKTPLADVPLAHTPLTIEGDDAFYAVHEAALDDYAAMTLKGLGDGRLACELVPWADGTKVKGQAPLTSPWRTIQIGRRAVDLLASNLILNLNEPNRLADTSWIKPQKYLGIWWGMHIGKLTWGSGPNHGASTTRAKSYIDSAKALGLTAVLIEGWNLGWDDWGHSNGFSFTQSMADFDLPAVTAYARSQGIGIIGHHETAGAVGNYERQVDAAFALYQQNGVRVVKTGYVADKIEGKEWHDGQFMVRHHRLMAEKAAKYGIMLDIHEPVKDTGLRRTFPNVMTREGARGGEYDAWDGAGGNPPSHTTIIPFTRGLSGPFDYTPGLFDLLTSSRPGTRVRTTLAKQLALYVVIYSPLQMAADLPENYVGHPAFQFIRDVAVDWEKTVPVAGGIGSFVTIARQARGSGDWYLGSITNETARTVDVALTFLDADRTYCAEIYRDAPDSHYDTKPMAYETLREPVTSASTLAVVMAPGGGQAVRFVPDALSCR